MMPSLPIVLSLDRVELTDEQFYRICQANLNTPLEGVKKGGKPVLNDTGAHQ